MPKNDPSSNKPYQLHVSVTESMRREIEAYAERSDCKVPEAMRQLLEKGIQRDRIEDAILLHGEEKAALMFGDGSLTWRDEHMSKEAVKARLDRALADFKEELASIMRGDV